MMNEKFLPDATRHISRSGGAVYSLSAEDGLQLRIARWPADDHDEASRSGVVVLLNGRGEFLEKHLETVESLTRRGFTVWSLDWRGQGWSDRMLDDRRKGYVDDFQSYVRDLIRLLQDHVFPGLRGRPLGMLCHSMGGAIGLSTLSALPGRFDWAVMSAPMVDFRRGGLPLSLLRLMARAFQGQPRLRAGWAPWQKRSQPETMPFADNVLTSCEFRFNRWQGWLRDMRDLAVGGVTWGWLVSAARQVARMQARDFARSIETPVLLVAAARERVVVNDAIRRLVMDLPKGRLVMIADAEHELLCEQDTPRTGFWRAFDSFTKSREMPVPEKQSRAIQLM